MEQQRQEVTWATIVPGFAVGLVVSALFFIPGLIVVVAALAGLVLRLSRRQGGPATWFCVGILIGCGFNWLLTGLHAAF